MTAPSLTSAPVAAGHSSNLQLLLHDPKRLLAAYEQRDQRGLAAECLLTIALGGALFGAAVGWYRGGGQALAAAIKLPIVSLASIALCAPALAAMMRLSQQTQRWRTTVMTLLVAAARSSLLLAAWAPLLWLAVELGFHYHGVKLFAAFAYGVAGLGALRLILHGFEEGAGRRWAKLGLSLTVALVFAQSAWLLRPYIGSPQDEQVPLLVQRQEGGVSSAVWRSLGAMSEAIR